MQIAQILQILSMSKFESPDRKLMDIYNKFDTSAVSNIIDNLIIKHCGDFERPVEKVNGIYKSHVLFAEDELCNIVNFLQKSYNHSTNDLASNDADINSFNCHIDGGNANYLNSSDGNCRENATNYHINVGNCLENSNNCHGSDDNCEDNGENCANAAFMADLLSSLTRLSGFCNRYPKNTLKLPKNNYKLTLTPKKSAIERKGLYT